jgi:hypothetical protein
MRKMITFRNIIELAIVHFCSRERHHSNVMGYSDSEKLVPKIVSNRIGYFLNILKKKQLPKKRVENVLIVFVSETSI